MTDAASNPHKSQALPMPAFGPLQGLRILDTGRFWVLEGVVSGTHRGKFQGHAATGRKVGCQFALFAWVKGGVITKSFLCGNPLAVVRQMGSVSSGLPPGLARYSPVARSGTRSTNASPMTMSTGLAVTIR